MLRPESIKSKPHEISRIRSLGVQGIEPGDILNQTVQQLAEIFAKYGTVVQCAGFGMPSGTQLKVARAALEAGVSRFVPWQFGCDYDVIGRGSVMELFDEMVNVRDLLRAQDKTSWLIVSVGLFTSFLFLPEFGVVDAKEGIVRALGAWDHRLSLTTPRDVGRVTAEAIFVPPTSRIVHAAGDTLSYAQVALLVEQIRPPRQWRRELWDLSTLRERLDGGTAAIKYQIVFGSNKGVAWDMETTLNYQRNLAMTDVNQYIRENANVLG